MKKKYITEREVEWIYWQLPWQLTHKKLKKLMRKSIMRKFINELVLPYDPNNPEHQKERVFARQVRIFEEGLARGMELARQQRDLK